VAVAPDGTWLATAGHDKTVRIWDRASGNCTATFTGHTDSVMSVGISPNGEWLVTAGSGWTVRIWNWVSGKCTGVLDGRHGRVSPPESIWFPAFTAHTRGWVNAVAISPDGTWIATAGKEKAVRIWNRVTGKCSATLDGHTGPVMAVAIAPDGTWIATASKDKTVRIWDAVRHNTVAMARTEGAVYSCAWGTDYDLAVAGEQGLYRFTLLN
jgi:WD40 repeat protein